MVNERIATSPGGMTICLKEAPTLLSFTIIFADDREGFVIASTRVDRD
jgi:hypothetical protein